MLYTVGKHLITKRKETNYMKVLFMAGEGWDHVFLASMQREDKVQEPEVQGYVRSCMPLPGKNIKAEQRGRTSKGSVWQVEHLNPGPYNWTICC